MGRSRTALNRGATASRATLCALLAGHWAGHCAAFTIFARPPPRSVTCRFVLERAPDAATTPPRRKVVRKSTQTTWEERYRELSTYRSTWGTADAPLGDPLGRWCRTQRQAHAEGRLDADRVAMLDALEEWCTWRLWLLQCLAPRANNITDADTEQLGRDLYEIDRERLDDSGLEPAVIFN